MPEVSRLCDCVIKLWRDKEHLWQWDIDQRVEVLEDDLSLQVHFVHNGEVLAVGVYEEGGKIYANIPNILLQVAGKIRGWVYRPGESASTLGSFDLTVVARQKSPDYVYTETEILTWYQLSERINQLEENGVGGSGAFVVEVTLDENWNPVPSHTREEVLAAINERKFVVLRIDGYELTLAPYPEFGEILPDDAELRFAVETGGRTLYLYWTAEGISFSEDDWVSRYTGLPEGNHSKNGTSHLIESVRQDVYGICYFAFRAFGDYRTGDTFTIRFYDGGDSEPYDVKVTPKLWNTEDLPDKYFTNGAMVACAFKDGTVPTLYFMGGKDGLDGKTPAKGIDYFTEADKAEMVEEVLEELPEIDVEAVTEITYADLKALRDNAGLKAGHFYRITDYVTTTVQANTQSANHPFDILIRAISESELETKVSALLRGGDEYFANNDLSAWELWYSLDNDTARFAWADAVNGKGVIYRMVDENDNDCPYDFKNIQMRNPLDTADENYYYTFDGNGTDHSLNGNLCFNNVISKYIATVQQINNIIFTNAKGLEVDNNVFDVKCYNNVFTKAQRNNHFGRECYGNNFLGYNYTNTFDTKFRNNTVGAESQSMQFGQGATGNVIGANTYYCRFGNYFRYNNTCRYMYYSEFGHHVQYCNFSESADVLEHHMRFLTFENNVQYVNLYKTDKTTTTYMENIRLCSGLVGKSASRIMIEVSELAQKYAITYANNSEGQLVKYCDADGNGGGADIEGIVQAVIDALPVYDGEVVEI